MIPKGNGRRKAMQQSVKLETFLTFFTFLLYMMMKKQRNFKIFFVHLALICDIVVAVVVKTHLKNEGCLK